MIALISTLAWPSAVVLAVVLASRAVQNALDFLWARLNAASVTAAHMDSLQALQAKVRELEVAVKAVNNTKALTMKPMGRV